MILLKLILFQLDPLPLATLIKHCLQPQESGFSVDEDENIDTGFRFSESDFFQIVEYSNLIINLNSGEESEDYNDDFYESLFCLKPLLDDISAALILLVSLSCNLSRIEEEQEVLTSVLNCFPFLVVCRYT